MKTLLEVRGMSCGSCVRHVSAALYRVDQVTDVEILLREGRVSVVHEPGVALETLTAAIEDAGYAVEERCGS